MPNICGANVCQIHMVGKTKLEVKLGQYRLVFEFIVCKSSAVVCILGADCCGKFFIAIRNHDCNVNLTGRAIILIV